ncbi:DUF6116 family protein [Xanthomonas maliensis]|uniref:DUF6116 family protein n=2 Tax=Xanthomonas maliensis TaxID=1321368 RepID=UPI0012646578|nr:DUF6116 family protein [Xanthomonas maliensis]KAB7763469.1 hypothetical protein CKY51_19945 [Xanthomonas maliensis]
MRHPIASRALHWASRLRYPTLFKLAAALLLVDVLLPDPIPLVDELLFGTVTLLLANWKQRKQPLDVAARQP